MKVAELTFANDIASHPIMFGIAAIMRDYKANQRIQSVHQSGLSRLPLAKQLSFHFLTSYIVLMLCYARLNNDSVSHIAL